MAKTASRTILLKGRGCRMERVAAGTITPGHFLTLNSDNEFIVNATARKRGPMIVAVENEHLGNPAHTDDGIDTNYVDNDYVQAEVCHSGMEVNALVAAAASAIVIGDLLELAADGTVRKLTPLTDNSGGTANTTLQDISASPAEAEIANNFADLAAYVQNDGAVAMALAAVDNSGGGTPARIAIMII